MTALNSGHFLSAWGEEGAHYIRIGRHRYQKLREARITLLFGLSIEQRYNILLENYAELEQKLLAIALNNAIFHGEIISKLQLSRHLANRLIVNFMSSARLYVDQTRHLLSSELGKDSPVYIEFNSLPNRSYDSTLSYRFLEALRNYSQHCGLPAHTINFTVKVDDLNISETKMRHTASVSVDVKMLRNDGNFKSKVLSELEAVADKKGNIPLLPHIRKYVACFGNAHETLRNCLAPRLLGADKSVSKALDQMQQSVGHKVQLFRIVKRSSSGREIQELIPKTLVDDRKTYESKNQKVSTIERQYVTSL